MSQLTQLSLPSDAQLVREALSGSREAFSRLMLEYGQRIYRSIFFIVHNIEDAKDLTQETFYRALRGLSSFDPEKPLYPWLRRIARNLALNFVGRSERRNFSLPEGDPFPSRAQDPVASLIASEEQAALRRALERLNPAQREIIILKHFEECRYAEIAEVLGIPIGTVMSRLYNARMKLKSIMAEESER